MRGTEPSGSPFQWIDGNVRHYCIDSEMRDDFEGAIRELRHAAMLIDAIGRKMGEADAKKGNVRNVAMTLRGAASNAERAYAKVLAGDYYQATGQRIDWKEVRDHGFQIPYHLRHGGDSDAEDGFW